MSIAACKNHLKLAKNVDEDPAVKHWLAVHCRDQVGNFLFGRSGCEKHISSGEKYITFSGCDL